MFILLLLLLLLLMLLLLVMLLVLVLFVLASRWPCQYASLSLWMWLVQWVVVVMAVWRCYCKLRCCASRCCHGGVHTASLRCLRAWAVWMS